MRQNRFMILLLAAALCTAQNGGNDLFQQGLRKERSEGDYKGAIEVYRRVLKQYASDRKLAAKALLQIAQCQERQGSKEARLSYERLIKEFGDQPQAVAEARARIVAIEVLASSAPRVRQVWAGNDVNIEGSLSPDGRWLSYAHWETGDLAVRDLMNNTNKLLTNAGGWEKSGGEFAEDSQFSPDGKRIAYNWCAPKACYELRVMNSDGTGVRTLGWANTPGYVVPQAWSPDGTRVLAYYYDSASGLTSLHMVNVATGERRELMAPRQWSRKGAGFSPDGQWIVLEGPGAEDLADTDLYIMPAGGGPPERLESNPALDRKPQWSSDGSAVLFASNRGGSFGLWRLPVSNGKASGVAQLIRGDLGANVTPIGFNRNGSLVYMLSLGGSNVYSADFDPQSMKRSSEPVLVSQRFAGKSIDPQPSPDGKRVAFIAANSARSQVVVVRDLSSGKELVHNIGSANHLLWTPDGKQLLLETTGNSPNTRELLWLDPQSGSTSPFQSISPTRTGLYPVFSKDGRTLYFVFRRWRATDCSIMAMNVANGQQQEVFKTDRWVSGLSLSPDGKSLATMQQSKPGNASGQIYSLLLVSLTGATERVVATGLGGSMFVAGPFTPDGTHVLFSRRTTGAHDIPTHELLSVDLSSGKLEPLNLVQPGMRLGTLAATGNKLYFSAGAPQNEIWIAENILPAR